MANNPVALIIPCHRVLAAGGKIGGFSAPGGSAAKIRMLALEGFTSSQRHRRSDLSGFKGGKVTGCLRTSAATLLPRSNFHHDPAR
jgi:hypothetical protein